MSTKKVLFQVIFICMFLAGCGQGQSNVSTSTNLPEKLPESTNTPVPSITPSTIPPTLTSTPLPTATPFPPFQDEFEQLLSDGWSWVEEVQFGWNLHERKGFLRIDVIPGVKQTLLRDAPNADFVISTRLLFTPYSNFQYAGLIIYQDDGHDILFIRGMCYMPGAEAACQGNALYFNHHDADLGSAETGYQVGPQFPTQTENLSEAYLRITREGNLYTAFFSADGETWETIGKHESELVPLFVGIETGGSLEYPADADFDYFTLEILE